MDIDNDVSTLLATIRLETESPELINVLYQLEDFYERKLWHQLTLSLDEFYALDESQPFRNKIYVLFISKFASNLNPLKVVDFVLLSFDSKQSHEIATSLLTLQSEFEKSHNEGGFARVYLSLQLARFYMLLGEVSKAEDSLEELAKNYDIENSDYSPKIKAAYYLTNCQLYKIKRNYNDFYRNGLLYLSSIEGKLPTGQQVELCYDLCTAALLGDKIYNFGELILHDILNVLKDNEYSWLYQMVFYLNAGNLKEFDSLLATAYEKHPQLQLSDNFLRQKIRIMALLELVSLSPTTDKTLKFGDISRFTGTPIDEVELLIIKCFSLNLIKGQIDQINQVLVASWLQPRILNLDQVKVLLDHLKTWDDLVNHLAQNMHKNGGIVWAEL
ncbi:26S proteasome regulatory subunit [Scheffersomyces spartinae]|uniref:26S proteasome regulatory subunit n=1 Tax=Scheffersomyces spartinae TaxID=45513 RepID=A0A9P8AJI1_9ASCO|nr:26S proteasome regulatory subunit [Scheffersomyces spartinae]KAG7194791.1 26S proteasome regulatory subunit [Scheffersomyces spartinae]